MASKDYDEDLATNPFFISIRRDFSDLFQQSLSEGFVVIVPRRGSLCKLETFSREEVIRHVLSSSQDFSLSRFHSVDGLTEVILEGEDLKVASKDDSETEEIISRLLFTETYYDEDMNKLQLWCVSKPFIKLKQNKIFQNLEDPFKAQSALLADSTSVHECVEFLRKFVGGQPLIVKIEQLAQDFERAARSSYSSQSEAEDDNAALSTDDFLINEAIVFFKSALNFAYSFPHVRANLSWQPSIAFAVETYFLHCVYPSIFQQLCVVYSNEDAILNRLIRQASISKIDPLQLGVRSTLHGVIPRSRKELIRIIDVTTPRSKIECLNRCLSTILNESDSAEFVVSADDLLPTLIFILTKTGVANWFAHLHYMSDYQLAKKLVDPAQNTGDKASFQLATLEAALEHIKSGGLSLTPRLSERSKLTLGRSSRLQTLFKAIEDNDVAGAKFILESSDEDLDSPDAGYPDHIEGMCHPLCTCSKCSDASQVTNRGDSRSQRASLSLEQVDDQGSSPLHAAARAGRPLLVELFLNFDRHSADLVDLEGRTALHVAAMFGHQNAFLLLLHADVNFNLKDKEGNTALILASSSGHTSCVKALLYYAEHQSRSIEINSENMSGETALHVASRWGFLDILKILLDYGAQVNTKNKRRETPISSAQNVHIALILKRALALEVQRLTFNQTDPFTSSNTDPFTPLFSSLPEPESKDEFEQKLSRLFKAINVGDVPLVAFYLGVDLNQSSQVEVLCHPFCDCVKCSAQDSQHQLVNPQLARRGKVPIQTRRAKDKVSVNARDSLGRTGLHVAAGVGNLAAVHLLLKAGAFPAQDIAGQTPLHVACQNGHIPVAEALLSSARSDLINMQDRRGQTALHLSVSSGNYDMVHVLLNRPCNISIKNNTGRSPLEEAKNNVAILELLKKHELKSKQSSLSSLAK